MEISIHGVTSIRTESYTLQVSNLRSRMCKCIYITDEKGTEYSIDLYGADADALAIKDEAELVTS